MRFGFWRRPVALGLLLAAVNAQVENPNQPYILLGESGKSVRRTAKEIAANLFLRNFQLLGRHNPGGDENLVVLVITHPILLAATSLNPANGMLASVCRIAVEADGSFTYVSVQNLPYWAAAYYGDEYPAVQRAMEAFMQTLRQAMPRFRGNFTRYYGGREKKPLTMEQIKKYRFNRRAPAVTDTLVLARFGSQSEAVEAVHTAIRLSAIRNY